MTIAKSFLAAAALAATLTQASCIVRPRRVHEVTMIRTEPQAELTSTEAPPAARVEVIPASPSANHVWVAGYWTRDGAAWVWMPGVYVVRPVQRTRWEPGHWAVRGHRWVWIPGHWS